MDQTTVSRNLDRLESSGFLDRNPDDVDARISRLSLTASGRRALKDALPIWRAGQKQVRKILGDDTADAIIRVAAELSESYQD